MTNSSPVTYCSTSAPTQSGLSLVQPPQSQGAGDTINTDEVGLVNPSGGLVTQEDANNSFDARLLALESVTVIDGGTY